MDPASVLESVAAAGKNALDISQTLHGLARDTTEDDQTVARLATEVETLGHTCNSARMQFEDIMRQYDTSRDSTGLRERQWSATQLKLDECHNTLERLHGAVERGASGPADVTALGLQTVRLSLNKDEMTKNRARVRLHTTALQISLQVILIVASHLELRYADHALLAKLDALQQKVDTWVAQQVAEQPNWRAENDSFLQLACEVLSHGTALFESSTRGGSNFGRHASYQNLFSAARSQAGIIPHGGHPPDTPLPLRPSTSRASNAPIVIFRRPVAPGVRSSPRIPNWIQSIQSRDSVSDRTVTASSSFRSPSIFSDQDDRRTVRTDATTLTTSDDGDKQDCDDDFEIGVARQALKLAREAFEAQEYGEADSHLQAAVETIEQLSPESRNLCNPRELQYLLAACTFHLKSTAEAEAALVALLGMPGAAGRVEAIDLEAGHLLSQVYVRQSKLNLAKTTCHDAVKGRWKLLGDKDPSYYESLALLSTIYQLQGNPQKSKMYASMVDVQSRSLLLAKFDDLLPPSESRKASSTALPLAETQRFAMNSKRTESEPVVAPQRNIERIDRPLDAFRQQPSLAAPAAEWASLRSMPSVTSLATLPTVHSVTSRPSQHDTPASRRWKLRQLGIAPGDELQEAIVDGDMEHANRLSVQYNSRPSGGSKHTTALHLAALFGELELAQTLLPNNQSQVNQSCKIPYSFGGKATPLHFAIAGRHTSMIRLLVANGATFNPPRQKSKFGFSKSSLEAESYPVAVITLKRWLHLESAAEFQEYIEVVRTLLSLGWDINSPVDSISRTLLHMAVRLTQDRLEYRKALVSFLVAYGANVLMTSSVGSIPLHFVSTLPNFCTVHTVH